MRLKAVVFLMRNHSLNSKSTFLNEKENAFGLANPILQLVPKQFQDRVRMKSKKCGITVWLGSLKDLYRTYLPNEKTAVKLHNHFELC